MGLISRVSSRTYRSFLQFTFFLYFFIIITKNSKMDAQPIKPALIQISYNSITRQTLCQQPFSFLDVTNLINRLFPKLAAKQQKQQQQPEDQEIIITDENFVEVSENNGDSFNIFVLETDENS